MYAPFIRYAADPERLDPGDRVDGGRSSPRRATPTGRSASAGMACSSRPTTCSAESRPRSASGPRAASDPLGDYLDALERTIALAPTIALPGHGEPIPDPVGRAYELIEHHRERLETTAAALGPEPADRLRGLVPALRRRPEAVGAAIRGRRDALAPRAARPRAARADRERGATRGVTYTVRS